MRCDLSDKKRYHYYYYYQSLPGIHTAFAQARQEGGFHHTVIEGLSHAVVIP